MIGTVVGRRAFIPLLAGVAGFFFFSYQRGYPFNLALVMGVASLLFAWAAVRTWDQLRGTFRQERRGDRE